MSSFQRMSCCPLEAGTTSARPCTWAAATIASLTPTPAASRDDITSCERNRHPRQRRTDRNTRLEALDRAFRYSHRAVRWLIVLRLDRIWEVKQAGFDASKSVLPLPSSLHRIASWRQSKRLKTTCRSSKRVQRGAIMTINLLAVSARLRLLCLTGCVAITPCKSLIA